MYKIWEKLRNDDKKKGRFLRFSEVLFFELWSLRSPHPPQDGVRFHDGGACGKRASSSPPLWTSGILGRLVHSAWREWKKKKKVTRRVASAETVAQRWQIAPQKRRRRRRPRAPLLLLHLVRFSDVIAVPHTEARDTPSAGSARARSTRKTIASFVTFARVLCFLLLYTRHIFSMVSSVPVEIRFK